MNKKRIISLLMYVAAIIFYTVCIISFATGDDSSNRAVWLSLGSAFLCLGSVFISRAGHDENDDEN